MCKMYGFLYKWCGHVHTPHVIKPCSADGSPVPDCKQWELLQLDRELFGGSGLVEGKDGFCDECLLDPERSTMARRVDGVTTLGYTRNKTECAWVSAMWRIVEPMCPRTGGDAAKFFKASRRRTMLSVYDELSKDFFWCLQNPDQRQPTMYQRNFLTFMRSTLESYDIMDLQNELTKDLQNKLTKDLQNGLTKDLFQRIKIESLDDNLQVCCLCREGYGHIHNHFPYRASCGHSFGGKCIQDYFKKHGSKKHDARCPLCNAVFKNNERLPSVEEPSGWLETLVDTLHIMCRD